AALLELGDAALAARARSALRGFLELIGNLACDCLGTPADDAEPLPLPEQAEHALARSGLREYYERDSRGNAESRVENLDELVNVAARFRRTPEDVEAGLSELAAFLSHAAPEA